MSNIRDYIGQEINVGSVIAYGRRDGNGSRTDLYVVYEIVSREVEYGWSNDRKTVTRYKTKAYRFDRNYGRGEPTITKSIIENFDNAIVLPPLIWNDEAHKLHAYWRSQHEQ